MSIGSIKGTVFAVSTSEKKGEKKKNQESVTLRVGHGIETDAHAGDWHRQVSLLSVASIEKMRAKGLNVNAGDFAENIAVEGIDLYTMPVGTRLKVGPALMELSQIGKECHTRCAIFYQAGDCVMPREGVFAIVLEGGEVKPGDEVVVLPAFRAVVVTVSDRGSKGIYEDKSGPAVAAQLQAAGFGVDRIVVIPDETDEIKRVIVDACDGAAKVDLVVTTGGTGVDPRDVTPDATMAVVDRTVPGMAEAMRTESMKKVPTAMLSRAVVGIRGKTMVVNLPGSPKGAVENLAAILPVIPHAVKKIRGDREECAPFQS